MKQEEKNKKRNNAIEAKLSARLGSAEKPFLFVPQKQNSNLHKMTEGRLCVFCIYHYE